MAEQELNEVPTMKQIEMYRMLVNVCKSAHLDPVKLQGGINPSTNREYALRINSLMCALDARKKLPTVLADRFRAYHRFGLTTTRHADKYILFGNNIAEEYGINNPSKWMKMHLSGELVYKDGVTLRRQQTH